MEEVALIKVDVKAELVKRGFLEISSGQCLFHRNQAETVDHLLFFRLPVLLKNFDSLL